MLPERLPCDRKPARNVVLWKDVKVFFDSAAALHAARVEALATDTLGMVFEHLNARELARFSRRTRRC